MQKIFTLLAVATVASISSLASAAPLARYYQETGKIELVNDTGAGLAQVSVLSPNGTALQPTGANMLAVSGAVKDDSEFPFAFSYLGLPVGTSNTGLTGLPGLVKPSAAYDLSFEYRLTTTGALTQGVVEYVPAIPEPATLAMGCIGLIGIAGVARRRQG